MGLCPFRIAFATIPSVEATLGASQDNEASPGRFVVKPVNWLRHQEPKRQIEEPAVAFLCWSG
jgi:hypothetical protein